MPTIPMRRATTRAWRGAVLLVLTAVGVTACSLDGLLNSNQLPPDVSDPAVTETPDGARAAYASALDQFRRVFGGSGSSVVAEGGLLTDEISVNSPNYPEDQRVLPEGHGNSGDATYSALQKVRGQAAQATGLLATYVPDQPALRGHLYALQAYAEIFLAELFCSGIPLSTLDYKGDFTYKPGSTTAEVFTHAVTLFDTALALAGDSARFVQLVQVGRARALLGLGRYADAAAAVASIPDSSHYDATFVANTAGQQLANFAETSSSWYNLTVPDREGSNGLDWRSSDDPRTRTTLIGNNYHPDKYATDGSSPIVVASGLEARLIEAEAALQANPDDGVWLATLNALRTDGTYDITATSPPDTLWHAGSGGYAGLRPLADPGTPAGRVDLLFRERAFWLFLTGHRQGDLRRLIRQYGRQPSDLYPVGPYTPFGSTTPYGFDVTFPIPAAESVNPLFTGCASRGA